MGLFSNDDKRKPAQKFGKGTILAGVGAYLAANIPPDGSAPWELAVYTGALLTLHNVLKYQFGVKIPILDD